MTQKDLVKVEKFIERYNKLPKDAELKYKIMFGEPTEDEKKEATRLIDEIDSLFIDIVAFVKVKFGNNSSYIKICNSIDFDTEIMGRKILTNDRDSVNRSWRSGIHRLGHMLKNLKAEVKAILDTEPDKLSIFQVREEKRLKFMANFIFISCLLFLPISCASYFLGTLINWNTFQLNDPLTWVDVEKFGKLEFLITIFELVILGISFWLFEKYREKSENWFYQRYRIK